MLDPVLLESFLAVAQARNFSEAGRRLGLRQSTISQHIRKLEEEAGRRLFVRDTHSVAPTADGEAMEGFARSILEANERARAISPDRSCAAGCGSARRRISSPPACRRCWPISSGASAGRPGTDRRYERHAVPDAGFRRPRSGAVQAPRRRRGGGWSGATGWPGSAPRRHGSTWRSRCRSSSTRRRASPGPLRWRPWSTSAGRGGSSAPAAV